MSNNNNNNNNNNMDNDNNNNNSPWVPGVFFPQFCDIEIWRVFPKI
jgi:hypothetical protein